MQVAIEASWKKVMAEDFERPYFGDLVEFLKLEKASGKTIYPAGTNIFKAFELTPFETVKVVILGQDPYHGPGQAMGLSFGVQDGVAFPPSLKNIFKELHTDIGMPIPANGNLSKWASQGVLLLNASLTVRAGEPNSHSHAGWLTFTNSVIQKINAVHDGVVFLLWGKFAQDKALLINTNSHFVLKAAHPSPLSAHNGFFGCKHFSKTNELLVKQKQEPIDWFL